MCVWVGTKTFISGLTLVTVSMLGSSIAFNHLICRREIQQNINRVMIATATMILNMFLAIFVDGVSILNKPSFSWTGQLIDKLSESLVYWLVSAVRWVKLRLR